MTRFNKLCIKYESLMRMPETAETQRDMAITAAEIRTEEKMIRQIVATRRFKG